jgi:hypothetical protein
MAYTVRERSITASEKITSFHPDLTYTTFVAKAQRTKTRKGKDYFVLRITLPKDKTEKMNANPDDFLLIRAKKALWYHMMKWNEMEPAWRMLPQEIKIDVIMAGLPNPDMKSLVTITNLQGGLTDSTLGSWSNNITDQMPLPTAPGASTGGQ